MVFQDILLNDEGDFLIQDGDLVIGNCEEQDAKLILESNQGEWKFSPETGCNILEYFNMTMTPQEVGKLKRRIREQFEQNGFNVKKINIGAEQFNIDCKKVK